MAERGQGLIEIWNRYKEGGLAAIVASVTSDDALAHLYSAVLRFAGRDYDGAVRDAKRAAARAPASVVCLEAARYLERVRIGGPRSVYVAPEAFVAFIRGGGNVPLYTATSTALRDVYNSFDSVEILDVGVGDGLALLPALTPSVRAVRLVEPSTVLLETTTVTLKQRAIPHEAFGMTAQAFVGAHPFGVRADVAQMTFSLQSISPPDRIDFLRWLRRTVPRFLVAEFDVPRFDDALSPAAFEYAAGRYETGLAEYRDDDGLVAQGFLMPVFFGYFDPTAARTNYEQPVSDWSYELRRAGFDRVEQRPLFDYWWAPAVLLDAQ